MTRVLWNARFMYHARGIRAAARYVFLILLLNGCATTIDAHKPAPIGWPVLTVRDNVVTGFEVLRRCYKYLPAHVKLLGGIPMACAEVNFAARTCDIWRARDASPEIMDHERMHCAGKDHPGETWAQDALSSYRSAL